jgi:hypothetical protein
VSFGKYRFHWLRFIGLFIILTAFWTAMVNIGWYISAGIDTILEIYPFSGTQSFFSDERIYGEIAIFIGSILLSWEKKE